MAYIDQATLAADATFSSRVKVAMMTAAVQIAAEAKGGNSETLFDKRQQMAKLVLQSGGTATLQWFIWAVVTNAAVTGSSLDSDIQFTVNSMWNAIAGVRTND